MAFRLLWPCTRATSPPKLFLTGRKTYALMGRKKRGLHHNILFCFENVSLLTVAVNSILDFFFIFSSSSRFFALKICLSMPCLNLFPSKAFYLIMVMTLPLVSVFPFLHLCIWHVFYATPVIHYCRLPISNVGWFKNRN